MPKKIVSTKSDDDYRRYSQKGIPQPRYKSLDDSIRYKQIEEAKNADRNISQRNFKQAFNFVKEFETQATPNIQLDKESEEARLVPLESAIENFIDTTDQRILSVARGGKTALLPIKLNVRNYGIADAWGKYVSGSKGVLFTANRLLPRITDALAIGYEATAMNIYCPEIKTLLAIKEKIQKSDYTPLNRIEVAEVKPISRDERRNGISIEPEDLLTSREGRIVERPVTTPQRYELLQNFYTVVKDQKDVVDDLATKIGAVETRIRDSDTEITDLKNETISLKNDLDTLKAEIKTKSTVVGTMKKELKKLDPVVDATKIADLTRDQADLLVELGDNKKDKLKLERLLKTKGGELATKEHNKKIDESDFTKLKTQFKVAEKKYLKAKEAEKEIDKEKLEEEMTRKAETGSGKGLSQSSLKQEQRSILKLEKHQEGGAKHKKTVLENRMQKQNLLAKALLPQSETCVFDDDRNDFFN